MKLLYKYSYLWISLVAILLTSSVLLFQSIRLDESQSIWISTKPIDTILKLTGEDVHVPLYSLLLHFWLQFLGTDIVVARLLSLSFLILSLPVIYTLCRESSDEKTALFATVLYSFSPFVAWFSYETRMYTLFILVSSLSNLFFLRFYRSEGREGKAGLFISTLIGFYTHYFFLILLLVQSIYILAKPRLIGKFILVIFPAAILFLPWIYYAWNLGGGSNTSPLIPPPTSYNIFQTFILILFGFQPGEIQSLFVALWPILLSILLLAFTQKRSVPIKNASYFLGATFLPVIIVFLISFIRPIFLARYLIFIAPTMFFLIASMLLNYSKRVSSVLVTISLIFMGGLLFYQNVSARTPVKENYESASEYLSQSVTSHDIVVVTAPFTVYPVEYYYRGQARIDTIPQWDRYQEGGIPQFSLEDLAVQVEKYRQSYSRMFILMSYDQGYEEEIKNYLDTNLERLNLQKFSEGLELRVYRLRYDILE